MDFFESQDQARRQTWKLLFLYVLGVACIIAALYLVAILLFPPEDAAPGQIWWHPQTLALVAAGTLLVIGLGAGYRIAQLRSGGRAVAEMLGGRQVNPNTTDPKERRLLNVVEEMAIASGVSVPGVYVLDEDGINAFAAGHTPSNAVVAVTRGCLESLNRDELQGVVAHEFSHILNGDMRLNLRLLGVLNGILVIYLIGTLLFRSIHFGRFAGGTRTSRRGGDARAVAVIIILAIAFTIIGYLGVIFARLIQAAISRQREYLADAAAVQFTRNPTGIGNALRKIGGASAGSRLRAAHAEEASHLFFSPGVKNLTSAFSTHPPLAKRIQAIDPSFDGKSWIAPKKESEPRETASQKPPPSEPATSGGGRSKGIPIPGMESIAIPPEALLAAIGTTDDQKISRAQKLLEQIPAPLRESTQEAMGAEAAIYALLLSADDSVREKQLAFLEQATDERLIGEIKKLHPLTASLPPACRLPLIDLSIPALRNLSPPQYESFRDTVSRLIEADEKVSLFEFTLEKALLRHLDGHFEEKPKRRPIQIYAARGLLQEFSVILSAFARAGEKDTEKAFKSGSLRLGNDAGSLSLQPPEKCGVDALDKAISRVDAASLPVKKKLIESAIYVVAADAKIAADEAEMLRALCDSLDCPMPPLG